MVLLVEVLALASANDSKLINVRSPLDYGHFTGKIRHVHALADIAVIIDGRRSL